MPRTGTPSPSSSTPLTITTEEGSDTETITVRVSRHGPLISDVLRSVQQGGVFRNVRTPDWLRDMAEEVWQLLGTLTTAPHDPGTLAALDRIHADYNARYGTNHSINEFDLYYQDVQKRIKDQQFLNADLPKKGREEFGRETFRVLKPGGEIRLQHGEFRQGVVRGLRKTAHIQQ